MLARPPPHCCQTFASVFPAREWCNVSGRRAVRPVTIAARLGPYLRYYASRRPTDDHGAQPAVLVVLTMNWRRTTSCA